LATVNPVNFYRLNSSDRPGNGIAFNNFPQHIALRMRQLFGIVEQWMFKIPGQNNRSGKYGSGQTAAPRFITTRFNQLWLVKCQQTAPACHLIIL
jgi:hypothetical protein